MSSKLTSPRRRLPVSLLLVSGMFSLLVLPLAAHAHPEPNAPLYVGGDIQAPVKIFSPAPTYTEEARKAHLQGVVIVQVVIDQLGNVDQVKVLKDLSMGLGEQAKEAVSSWLFEPAMLNGQPVVVYYNLTVNFRLDSKEDDGDAHRREGSDFHRQGQSLDGSLTDQREKQPEYDGPLYVGGDVQAPVKVSTPHPTYTEEARKARLQGVVILQVVIDQLGNVTHTRVLKGLNLGLDEQAKEAVSTWQFEPAMLNGQPVAVYYNLTVNFRLE